MTGPKYISSLQNQELKRLLSLREKARERKKTGLFLLEGKRELQLARQGGYQFEALFFCPEILSEHQVSTLGLMNIPLTALSPEVYQKLAYRQGTEGVLALARMKDHSLGSLRLKGEKLLLLVAEAPEKPGNLGALLRTADAAALDAVLIADPKGDLYNPNTIRSSVGCLFTVPVATGSSSEVMDFLKQRGIQILAASLGSSIRYDHADFKPSTAIAVGTEATGLTRLWSEEAEARVEIPMQGVIDSMNVSVAAAILIYEAKRQRGFLP